MDPASLSLGVVALAMQVVQAAKAIHEYIDAYKSASKDIRSLADKLDNIEAICNSLEVAFQGNEKIPEPRHRKLLETLHKVMSKCRDRVSELYTVISKIYSAGTTKRRPLATVGALFLKYRAELRKCGDDLDDSLRLLHIQVSTITFALMSRTPMPHERSIVVVAEPDEQQVAELCAPDVTVLRTTSLKPQFRALVNHTRWTWGGIFDFYQTTTARHQNSSCSSDPIVDEEVSFQAGIPLFHLYIRISLQYGALTPWSLCFEFPQVLDWDDVVAAKARVAIWDDDIVLFQKLLSTREISLNTLIHDMEDGDAEERSLFDLTLDQEAYNVCKFLHENDPNLIKHQVGQKPPGLSSWLRGDPLSTIYVEAMGPYFGAEEGSDIVLAMEMSPHNALGLIEACHIYFADDPGCFYPYLEFWVAAELCRYITAGDFPDAEAWVPVIRRIYNEGNDFDASRISSLAALRDESMNPIDSLNSLRLWIALLNDSGVDLDKYLQAEFDVQAHMGIPWYFGEVGLYEWKPTTVQIGGWTVPWQDFQSPESCHIRELATEFNFLVWQSDVFGPWVSGNHQGKCVLWGTELEFRNTNWPITFPNWTDQLDDGWDTTFNSYKDKGIYKEKFKRRLLLQETRFNRKQLKKLRKAKKLGGDFMAKTEMPGAWLDEYDI